ncbi:MAG: ATP-dependent DNA helicase, partial [Marinirhabdus sp.]
QDLALQLMATFVTAREKDTLFLLKGYAGTGKTTLIGTLVKNLRSVNYGSVLLAPTGRAAKVISNYSEKQAFTIHKKIYSPQSQPGGGVRFTLKENNHRNVIFIVDEASMVPDTASESKLFENGSLLGDLVQYVYTGQNCKLLLVGDTAQLPPVKLDLSPALNEGTLRDSYNKTVTAIELDEVVRQQKDSGILYNATAIRAAIEKERYGGFKFMVQGFPDIIRPSDGTEVMNVLNDAYANLGNEGTVFLVRSNKRANLYNKSIRQRILFQEAQLAAGDYLMVVKNDYYWLDPYSEAGFIANGDIVEVLEISGFRALYGFHFAEARVRLVDYPKLAPFSTVLLLDTLTSQTPSLSYEDSNRLYQEVIKDYAAEKSKYKKMMKVKKNKFFNALRVKFSYAITCHKAQGGQWHTVFVEMPYTPKGIDKEVMRWLYTAVTRARERLYLVGFKDGFFDHDL